MSINRVMCTGHLTRDPELRQTASGMSVLSFGIAVNDRRKNSQTGEWDDYANFLDCTLFGARADGVSQYIHKGSKVAIEGKLRWSQWETEGQKRSKVEIIVDNLDFMTSKQDAQPAPAQPVAPVPAADPAPVAAAPAPAQPAVQPAQPAYDDIPFN